MNVLSVVAVCVCSISGLAQARPPDPPIDPRLPQPEWILRVYNDRIQEGLRNGKDEAGMIADRPESKFPMPPQTKPDGKPYSARELEDIKRKLLPSVNDTLLAFRIVRMDPDGSITVLWRELQKKSSPKIIYAPTDSIADLK